MMRLAVVAAVLAGCASGSQNAATSDGPPVTPDAKDYRDAPMQPIDAPAMHADAHVTPDAHVTLDAFVYHDAPPPPDACTPVAHEMLLNPVFDSTPMGTSWTAQPIDSTYPIITADSVTGVPGPQSAPYRAWLGGWSGDQKNNVASLTDVLSQDIAIPAGATNVVITGYYAVITNESPGTGVFDTAAVDLVQTNDTPIEAILATDNTSSATSWTAFSHTFTTSVAGQTVRLRFTSTNDITNATNFLFDTLSLKATYCP